MKSISWGIVGTGKIANRFAADLQLLDGCHLHAVASRNLERAKSFAEATKSKTYYSDYQSLFEDMEVDIIYIATPHSSHMEYSISAMNAGKHVLCEKPLAVNEFQVQKMINASERNKVFLMEAFWTRFMPSMKRVISLIDEGELGEVNYINADFCFYKEASSEHRMFNMDLAGGSLLDVGVYPIFLAYQIFGFPEQIHSNAIFHETGADLQTSIILKYKNALANLGSGFGSKTDMIAKIHGKKGRIEMQAPWHHSSELKIITDNDQKDIQLPLKGRGFVYEIQECLDCIRKGEIQSNLWSHKNSLDLILICDQIRQQIKMKYPFE